MHLISLESHHRVVLTWAPSMVATDCNVIYASRSTYDCTQVSLYSLPIVAFEVGAPLRQNSNAQYVHWFLRLAGFADSRENVKDVLYYEIINVHFRFNETKTGEGFYPLTCFLT